MSGSDSGAYQNGGDRGTTPARTVSARSASPAKRNAAEMEGEAARSAREATPAPGSFPRGEDDEPTDFDMAMEGLKASGDGVGTQEGVSSAMDTQESETNGVDTQRTDVNAMDTQETAPNSIAASTQDDISTSTSITSIQSEAPAVETNTEGDLPVAQKTPYSTDAMGRQVAHVEELCAKLLQLCDEGSQVYLVSKRWLDRVLSRTSQGEKENYPKEAREGPVGELDNSDIVADRAYQEPVLYDAENHPYIPLKPDMLRGVHFEVLPKDAYFFIVGLYGFKQKDAIVRYMHNTTEDESKSNLEFEYYPPIITIRKVPQPGNQPEPPIKAKASMEKLRLSQERKRRGQMSSDDAVRLVTSRAERVQNFLARSKQAAGIPLKTKVKVWRLLNASNVSVDVPGNTETGVLSPPTSRDTSPGRVARTTASKLVLDLADFKKLGEGDFEFLDVTDQTSNDKYNGKSTLRVVGLFEDQTILLEEQIGGVAGGEFQSDNMKKPSNKPFSFLNKGKNGTASKPASTTTSGRTSPAPGMMTRGRARKDGRTRGAVGLQNLGNTCYMNSALQCIRSVEELAIFFLSQQYKKEINPDNALGHGGAMAKAYATVLDGIYSEKSTSAFSPNYFKRVLGNAQPLFSGYGQQDSQEFLSFLVDALHEDLNRIIKKPYNENPDSDDKTVHDPQAILDLGEIYRKNHQARNDSIAMDLFNGFYKNTMECPDCEKISITFDPYSLLTLQLPMDHTFQHRITFLPLHGRPIIHEVDIDKNSTVKYAKEWIARKHPGCNASRLWMAEVYQNKIYKVFDDFTTMAELSVLANDHIFVFELHAAPTNLASPKISTYSYSKTSDDSIPSDGMNSDKAECMAVPILHRIKSDKSNSYSLKYHPLHIAVTREEAKDFEIILKKILIAVARITSRPILTESLSHSDQPSSQGQKSTGSTAAKDASVGNDSAGVSDHSAQSEDGYVNISTSRSSDAEEPETNGARSKQDDEAEDGIPRGFLDPEYRVSDALRNLFDVKYACGSGDSMHYKGSFSPRDMDVRPMFQRVKLPSRRPSSSPSTSGESSTDSAVYGDQDGAEEEESTADDMDLPDLVLGGEDQTEKSDGEELPANAMEFVRSNGKNGGRRNGKNGKKNRRRNQRNNKGGGRHSLNHSKGTGLTNGKTEPEESPYYIQLGDAIILDWHESGIDSLFNGDPKTSEDMRGYALTDDHGSGQVTPIFQDAELDAKRSARAMRRKHGISLEDCFAETGKREILSEDNAWYCGRCKEMRRAAKTLQIWTMPDVLVVHLKRFGGNRTFRDKIDTLVEYPIEGLDMTDKVGAKDPDKEYVYDLFAVDMHFGGLGGGHYTAMAKNFYDGFWYEYNDSVCHKIGAEPKLSAAAYLLFYRRRSDKALGGPALQEIVQQFRDPSPEADFADADESGEGSLGDPTRPSLHGSSSVSTGAGAAATKGRLLLKAGRGAGLDGAASSSSGSLIPTPMTRSVRDEAPQFGNVHSPPWDFTNVDDTPQRSSSPLMRFGESRDGYGADADADGDNDSNQANRGDQDSAFGGSDPGMDRNGDYGRPVEFDDVLIPDAADDVYATESPYYPLLPAEHREDSSMGMAVPEDEPGRYDDDEAGTVHDIVLPASPSEY